MISYEEAVERILAEANLFPQETVDLRQAFRNVLAEEINSDRDYPPFNRSAMDGFAISSHGYQKDKKCNYERELHAGAQFLLEDREEAIRIMTGAPVPLGFDVVIKIEDSVLYENAAGSRQVSFNLDKVGLWQNIAKRGEDLVKGELVLSPGQNLGTSEISLLASLGRAQVLVFKAPHVKIISTGNEIIHVNQNPLAFQIRDSNSYTIASVLSKYKIFPTLITNVRDEETVLTSAINEGLESDLLILSGGVSQGNLDLVPAILQKLGVEMIFHSVKIKPGKPIWFGKRGNTIVFGMPGNPFSVQTCTRLFLEPFLDACMGKKMQTTLRLPLRDARHKKGSLTEFFPVKFETSNGTQLVNVAFNGSGDIRAGLSSDGLAMIPSSNGQIEKGEYLDFFPW